LHKRVVDQDDPEKEKEPPGFSQKKVVSFHGPHLFDVTVLFRMKIIIGEDEEAVDRKICV
jgi:hypothetical protein